MTCQDQKRRLKDILGILIVPQNAPAHAEHQRPVPANERRKRRLIAPARKLLDELRIRPRAGTRGSQFFDAA
jgi:hypothetical protein